VFRGVEHLGSRTAQRHRFRTRTGADETIAANRDRLDGGVAFDGVNRAADDD
jgi:hypothetical protein